MTFLLRFTLAATMVVFIADIIPFPDFPPGFVSQMISQNINNSSNNSR
ncbi:hypothetical protein VB715_16630 [Crocosphaera sp. UHCC 0190]|nr:hypothetical protein [Crocosphaera sp. UHCC 0190]MEA5511402.1 hypothetical protein [Crocosphaera sp. UHCC 0190]